ncbi:hypothetical protein [Sedimenticola selenatireducens]|uniref:DsrE family protein n=2 Tax=Sedimenticola TaxID=349742 RepID=A0A558CGK8_9GAMM|nr:hypothetical protein [Sedimenticola selenatireducens]MCW8882032.1 hypothetical protein [Sedimenticola sp.]TVT47906.1 MAG: hypothetical protein FHK82_17945 [Sedimenticola thiotaurini]MCW8946488.1 hypothetical protein [Sedimenticola sp.]MCW8949417.1 hypothetical protein [Sedimenticola sp.]MCW8974338.1 hypothetical protein [Sedimenticola sp.]
MSLLFIVSTPGAARLLLPLISACKRKGTRWSCFFTNDGVNNLSEPGMKEAACCAERVVVCEHSWARFMGDTPCPVELGSQTQNSIMVGEADRIVSL